MGACGLSGRGLVRLLGNIRVLVSLPLLAPLSLRSPLCGTYYTCVCTCVHVSYHGACPWRWRSCCSCGQACLMCHASSCVDGLQREGGGWISWRFSGRRVRWCGGVVYVVLLVYPWSFYPCGVRGGGFGLALPRLTLLVYASVCGHTTCSVRALRLVVCVFGGSGLLSGGVWLPSLGFVGVGDLHTIAYFRIGCPLGIPSYRSCSVPRCWRPPVLRVFFGGVYIFFCIAGFLPR